MQKAKSNIESGKTRWIHWWCKKYNLPPNHELLQSRTLPDLELEFLEEILLERADLVDQLSKISELSTRSQLSSKLAKLNKILEDAPDEESDDPLIDKWEKELDEGKIPDLNEGL